MPELRLLRALARQPTDRPPIWLMRQAGRHLPEYRRLRERAGSFMNLCRNPQWAAEATMQPMMRYPLDAAILFSDILIIPDAMGLGLEFCDGRGPRFAHPLRCAADIERLPPLDSGRDLAFVTEAVREVAAQLDGRAALIGFAGSPWTLATYMIEGGSSRDFGRAKALLYDQPLLAHRLLEHLAAAVAEHLGAQIAAGAQVVQIFDSWGGVLSDAAFAEFSLRYMELIVERLREAHPQVPMILFTRGGGNWLQAMAASGCQALGLDWCVPLGAARRLVGRRVALQGGMDPAVLRAAPQVIAAEARRIVREYRDAGEGGAGHIFNLGHGLRPDTDPQSVNALVEAVAGCADAAVH